MSAVRKAPGAPKKPVVAPKKEEPTTIFSSALKDLVLPEKLDTSSEFASIALTRARLRAPDVLSKFSKNDYGKSRARLSLSPGDVDQMKELFGVVMEHYTYHWRNTGSVLKNWAYNETIEVTFSNRNKGKICVTHNGVEDYMDMDSTNKLLETQAPSGIDIEIGLYGKSDKDGNLVQVGFFYVVDSIEF